MLLGKQPGPILAHTFAALVLLLIAIGLVWFQRAPIEKSDKEYRLHYKMIPQRLKGIEKTLNALVNRRDSPEPAAVAALADIFAKVSDDENNRTTFLQQRASSLLSAAALTVSVILASISLMARDIRKFTRPGDLVILFYLLTLALLIFGISLFWTWQGFEVLPFESLSAESVLSNMDQDGAGLQTVRVAAVMQHYKLISVNEQLNTIKAEELRWATADLFLGLLVFSIFCVFVLIRTSLSPETESVGRSV